MSAEITANLNLEVEVDIQPPEIQISAEDEIESDIEIELDPPTPEVTLELQMHQQAEITLEIEADLVPPEVEVQADIEIEIDPNAALELTTNNQDCLIVEIGGQTNGGSGGRTCLEKWMFHPENNHCEINSSWKYGPSKFCFVMWQIMGLVWVIVS
jgi:hypothetical protein